MNGKNPPGSTNRSSPGQWAVLLALLLFTGLAWGLATDSLPGWSSDPAEWQRTRVLALSILTTLLSLVCGTLYWRHQVLSRSFARTVALSMENRKRYRFLAEGPPSIGIVRFTVLAGRFTDVNRAAITMLGCARSSIIGHPIESFVSEEDRDALQRALEKLGPKNRHAEFTLLMALANGIRRHVSWHVSLSSGNDREPEAIAILMDATERLKAESERLEKERLAGVLEMAGAAAHELNQPLQVAMGACELLGKRIPADDSVQHLIGKLRTEIERMASIGKKIAGISRYEVKDYVGNTRIVDIDKASSGGLPDRHAGPHPSASLD